MYGYWPGTCPCRDALLLGQVRSIAPRYRLCAVHKPWRNRPKDTGLYLLLCGLRSQALVLNDEPSFVISKQDELSSFPEKPPKN